MCHNSPATPSSPTRAVARVKIRQRHGCYTTQSGNGSKISRRIAVLCPNCPPQSCPAADFRDGLSTDKTGPGSITALTRLQRKTPQERGVQKVAAGGGRLAAMSINGPCPVMFQCALRHAAAALGWTLSSSGRLSRGAGRYAHGNAAAGCLRSFRARRRQCGR